MLQFEAWKKTLVILVAALGIIYAAPNLLPVEREGGGILPGQKINLGLDLQGGSHLLLRVDMDAVVEERLESVAETIRQEFRGRKIRFSGLDVRNAQVRVRLRDTGDKAEARTVFRSSAALSISSTRAANTVSNIASPVLWRCRHRQSSSRWKSSAAGSIRTAPRSRLSSVREATGFWSSFPVSMIPRRSNGFLAARPS